MVKQAITRNSLLLGLFALVATGIIAGTFLGTKDEIAERQREAKLKALNNILRSTPYNNDLLNAHFDIQDQALLGHRAKQHYVIAKHDTQVTAVIIPATAPDGYSGNIDLLVGIDAQSHEIIGVRVIAHKETPGLGDKIEVRKSDWILSFNGYSLQNLSDKDWAVNKDGGVFDSFTGATITPRATVAAVHRVLQYYHQHRDTLIDVTGGVDEHSTATVSP